jgi:hypothetical protein
MYVMKGNRKEGKPRAERNEEEKSHPSKTGANKVSP